ncbi:hypothetical protein BWK59_11710 [Flavobacterium davisii]|uniref:Uncharacterized protein n=1 Tax=Flavobacterium davisii TaxID=2906077 RepID=A0A246GGF5_9FLAO|nr:hypothetical protein [Flavobacterium davisii]OWP83207.1 hypothetical protein BWK59_11710 [Flavobacterium davisii]
MKQYAQIISVAILAVAINTIIDVDPVKVKPPTGGRTFFIERDKGGGKPLAFKDRSGGRPKFKKDKKTLKPPTHRAIAFIKNECHFLKNRENIPSQHKV